MSDIKEILSKYKKIAMIGVSNDPTKASTIVMKYMQNYGFKVYPVNPRAKGQKILGEKVFEKITDIKDPIDIVDVFRPSKEVLDIAKDTIDIGMVNARTYIVVSISSVALPSITSSNLHAHDL